MDTVEGSLVSSAIAVIDERAQAYSETVSNTLAIQHRLHDIQCFLIPMKERVSPRTFVQSFPLAMTISRLDSTESKNVGRLFER